jgi:hypothetical protein
MTCDLWSILMVPLLHVSGGLYPADGAYQAALSAGFWLHVAHDENWKGLGS